MKKIIRPLIRCLSFAPKFLPFIYMPLQLTASLLWNRVASLTLKSFSRRVFSWKSEKHLGQLVWNSFVYFTVDEEKSQQKQRKGEKQKKQKKKITRSKLTLYFLSELYILFCLLFIFKPAFLVKFIHTFVVFFFSKRRTFFLLHKLCIWGPFSKTFTRVIYKCSHCFRV